MEKPAQNAATLNGADFDAGMDVWGRGRQETMALMEFHISREARDRYHVERTLFSFSGNVVFADLKASRELAHRPARRGDPRQREGERAAERDGGRDEAHAPEQTPA